jgi:hypothetical protein
MNTQTVSLQAELDEEGMQLLIKVLRAARSFTFGSVSEPLKEARRQDLKEAVWHFDNWEAGAMLVPVRD